MVSASVSHNFGIVASLYCTYMNRKIFFFIELDAKNHGFTDFVTTTIISHASQEK